jgi:hypothetical protein
VNDPGSEPPPPPPPPDLAPPPGYAAYQASPASSAPLRPISRFRTAILVLLAVYAVATLVQLAGLPAIVDSARDLLDGTITEEQFEDDYAQYNLAGLLLLASQIAIVVLTMMWLFRIAKNHQALGRRLTWAPGWAIGGWFLPPIVYVIPTLMLRESWKAADPEVPAGDERWKASSDSPLLWIWAALYVVVPLLLIVLGLRQQFGMMSTEAVDIAESIDDHPGLLAAGSVVVVLSALAWGLFVRALTTRHATLTGEAATR